MKLSVVIVNYNVCAFLEQALASAQRAMSGIDGEIFVVDNNSADNSVRMVREKFPDVILIENRDNVGFSKANNQAIRQARGEYILLLNPDTVVEEDTFGKCVAFMDKHPECGALGVKMVDGNGRFLPESKRGIPYPSSAFYKLFGLSRLFPRSSRFGAYHATYVGEDQTAEVEVLSGAFMFLRREALDKVGLLDEDYFMYGEDIDLSYRILKGGYKNYYFPETRIIHYKGESTKKGSLNYVYVFYKAMQIFAQKHFSSGNAKVFNFFINVAIWFRASLAALKRIVGKLLLPAADFALIFTGFLGVSKYWEHAVLAHRGSSFPEYYYYAVLPGYVLLWQLSVLLNGGYRQPYSRKRLNRGVIIGAAAVLAVYALMPESMRFSRAVVVMGAMWTIISVNFMRYVCEKLHVRGFSGRSSSRRIAIVGSPVELVRVLQIVRSMNEQAEFIGLVTTGEEPLDHDLYIGNASNLEELIAVCRVAEVVFCGHDLSSGQIIAWMSRLQHTQADFKIAPEDSLLLIGGSSIFSLEDRYTLPANLLGDRRNLRRKRVFDVLSSLAMLLLLPADIWFVKDKGGFVRNMFAVISGKRTWVGLRDCGKNGVPSLPQGVLFPDDIYSNNSFSKEMVDRIEELYARDYSVGNDFRIMVKSFSRLGR
ncbi:MAG: glycosyltransferase [Bacteroidales bacterium]|nr:glycosyltransferase [Bacteroidales bacterium]